MSLLKEPYDPASRNFFTRHANYSSLYQGYITIQTGNSQVAWYNIFWPSAIIGAAGSIALGTSLLALIALLIIPILWIVVPRSRPVNQERWTELFQDGRPGGYSSTRKIPNINWKLFSKSDIYKSAVIEWMDAVRSSGDLQIHRKAWEKYLTETENLASTQEALTPDFGKIKILKEVLGT